MTSGFTRALGFAAAAALVGTIAFHAYFGSFGFGDDDGYVMLSISQYLAGRSLYSEVFTQYGPFYYHWSYLIHRLFGVPLTHDAVRALSVAHAVIISAAAGLIVHARTRAVAPSIAVQVLTGTSLLTFREGPGHPQELVLLISLCALLAICRTSSVRLQAAVGGAASALLALTKINAGAFFAAALFFALYPRPRDARERGTFIVLSALLLSLPAVLTFRHAGHVQVLWLVLLSTSSIVLVLYSIISAESRLVHSRQPIARLATVFAATAVAVLLIEIAAGADLHALISGTLLNPVRFPGLFFKLFWLRWVDVVPMLIGAALVMYTLLRRQVEVRQLRVAEAAFGIAFMHLLAMAIGDFLVFRQDWIRPALALGVVLAWIIVLPQDRATRVESEAEAVADRALALFAVLFLLYVYPVAGTQLACASVPLAVVAGVALGRACGPGAPPNRFVSALLVLELLHIIHVSARVDGALMKEYRAAIPLRLPGAQILRSAERDVTVYRFLVANLTESTRSFMSLPGLNSLYLWSRIEPPTGMNSTAWMVQWNDDIQQNVRQVFEREHKRGAVWNDYITRFWLSGPFPEGPLVAALRAVPTVFEVRKYELKLKESPALTRLKYAALILPGEYDRRGAPGHERYMAVEYGGWMSPRVFSAEVARIGKRDGSGLPSTDVAVPVRVLADGIAVGGGTWALLGMPSEGEDVEAIRSVVEQGNGESMAVVRLFDGSSSASDGLSIPVVAIRASEVAERQPDLLGMLLYSLTRGAG